MYVFRCPEYEALMEDEQAETDNNFLKVIEEQKKQLTKQ